MAIIECVNIGKIFQRNQALNNFSAFIEENKITGLIGRNGAGKTTLLKIIAGYLKPTSGEVKVFGHNPFNNLQVSANLIFIDEHMTFPESWHLEEIFDSIGLFYPNWNKELALRLLAYFSISPKQTHNSLSKGMRSTFHAIIGLAARSPLTIFDEPTTGMDAAVRKDFYRALLKDYVEHPRTILLSSHLLNEIENILEDILLIKNGTKCLHLPVTELKNYALGLRGKADALNQFLNGKEEFYRENFAPEQSFVVVKNDFSEAELRELKKAGISTAAVPTEDVCVYLTAQSKGGISDVFNRD
ncbi:MAG TPA: ABC transporter ATP-binding protein [Peptococcaceae bacterium]|nr:ABC transporter ATP-binding protein [Peptococcaceae bacterium]